MPTVLALHAAFDPVWGVVIDDLHGIFFGVTLTLLRTKSINTSRFSLDRWCVTIGGGPNIFMNKIVTADSAV